MYDEYDGKRWKTKVWTDQFRSRYRNTVLDAPWDSTLTDSHGSSIMICLVEKRFSTHYWI